MLFLKKAKRYDNEDEYSLEYLQKLKKDYDSSETSAFDTQKQITALAIETAIEWRLNYKEFKKLKE